MGKMISLAETRQLIPQAAEWFSKIWGLPTEAYLDSMGEMSAEKAVPRWYVYMEEDEIAGGLGIIENDFHERKDLTPNLCAIYVVPKHRGRGIAGRLLARVCEDMHEVGVDTLYLVTDHTTFYERYGWKYLCDTREHGGGMARVYVHEYKDTGR
ncbi:GNAT family N-acetyltransferase [uncultured Ruminococcus sp.]|uniref:GNAT family N-acetyltransferase n=1 Tax=uncultured Ruminococcus sp. TaxID=165186 RepID=UPI0025F8DB0A|nr:GNAT family N-acetyltransferase [uncultured Ruminococcus sp.]